MAEPKETREVEIVLKAQAANASIKEMAAGVALMNNQLTKMAADDPRRAQLKRDFDVLSDRVGAARKELRTYQLTEEEVRQATEKLNQENREVILNGQKVNASFNEMRASAAKLEEQLHDLSADDPGRKKMLADYHALQERIEGVSGAMTRANTNTSFFKSTLSNAFAFATGGGIEALVEKTIELGKDVFDTTAKFEKFETVLTNALGDNSKAKKALADIQNMAASTPFSVEELTDSYLKFVNRGLTPSMEQMTKMGDIAASQGKSFDQLTEAVLDAGTGEFERLKEFGISASKSGDQVSLSFKGINQTVKNTPEAINGAILKFGEMKGVAGNMAGVSKTLEGTVSNLGDTFGQLEVKVGGGLKPVFVFLLGLFGQFLGWITRFIDQAAPLKTIFSEISEVFAELYHDIGDVLESLGLFSDKTDTVKIAVEALKFILTAVLLPVKAIAMAARGIVDTFIDWYNKSELLRGVLGGLGAAVTSLFLTIKDDALKILGGVGDILVGIFTLDKDKIIAGFKSALSATADVALESGARAADAFGKGYEANKNSRITRTVRVKTTAEADGPSPSTEGIDLKSDASAGDAAAAKAAEAAAKRAKAERDRRDREHLADLKRWVKDEGDVLDERSELDRVRQEQANTDELKRMNAQRQKIVDDADKKYEALRVLEGDHTKEMEAVIDERNLKLRELQARWDEEGQRDRDKQLDEEIKRNDADLAEKLAYLQLQHANKMLADSSYDEQVYQAKQAAMDRELALVRQRYGEESAEYKKLNAEKIRDQAAHNSKAKSQDDDLVKFKKALSKTEALLNSDNAKFVEENLGKQTVLYKAFQAARKATAIANIGRDLIEEIQGYWKSSSGSGPIGIAWAIAQSVIATARSGMAAAKIAGFEKGGATGGGMAMARPVGAMRAMWDVMSQATGLQVDTGGQLVDDKGLKVAGVVHENEYVIPAWLRQDPKVVQMEDWLEARRLRGYIQGGRTSNDRPGTTADVAGDDEAAAGDTQLVRVLTSLDQRLQKVEEWPTQLEVYLDLLRLDREQKNLKEVQTRNGIKS